MRFFEHIKLALFIGLISGILHGLIDIFARVINGNYEWFEFYQALFFSILAFTLFFVLLGISMPMLKFFKLKLTKRSIIVFYSLTAVFSLLFFYFGVYYNRILFTEIPLISIQGAILNIFPLAVFSIAYLLLLIKGKDFVFGVVSIFKNRKIKNIVKRLIVGVLLFIVVSFLIGTFLLNYVPNVSSDLKNYPNIVLISMAATRADHLSLYGYGRETSPNIDVLSENAIVFENAITASSMSLSSHASIFTGKYPSNHGVVDKRHVLDDAEETLAEVLTEKGYITVGFIGSQHNSAIYNVDQGFARYNERLDFIKTRLTYDEFSMLKTLRVFFPFLRYFLGIDAEVRSTQMNKDIFRWIKKNKEKPFFIFAYYFDVHPPYQLAGKFTDYEKPEEFLDLSDFDFYGLESDVIGKDNVPRLFIDSMVKFYDNQIFELDNEIGNLITKLEELGLIDNTLIIITADHGEAFGEHGIFHHNQALYQELIHVPLIIYYPEEFKAQRISETISTIDILPTILNITNIDAPRNIDGVSLIPLIQDGRYDREYILSEYHKQNELDPDMQIAVLHEGWKLIDTEPETKLVKDALYNLIADPGETTNLYKISAERAELLRRFIADSEG